MKREYVVRIRPRRWLRGLVFVLLLVTALGAGAYAGRARILTWIGSQLVDVDPLERADAILVLAGGSPERELEAADLYRAGWAPRIVLTRQPEHSGVALLKGRGIDVRSELEERIRYLTELHVPRDAIVVLEPIAQSTSHESRMVLDWARANRAGTLLVVTSAFHTGRARLILERTLEGSGVTIRMRAASADQFHPGTWWRNRVTLRNGVIEWQKQIYTRLGGG